MREESARARSSYASTRMRAARAIGLVAVIAGGSIACGAIVGLEDHVLAPGDGGIAPGVDGATADTGGVPPDGAVPGGCDACPAGYGCVDGRCGNVVASGAGGAGLAGYG